MFKKLLGITDFQNFRYEQVFPEEEGAPRFDWSVVLGHAGEFYSTSYFYSYSTILNRWIRFLVVGPQRGMALVAAEDITQKILSFPRTAGIVENG
jgi:hypothetical protein